MFINVSIKYLHNSSSNKCLYKMPSQNTLYDLITFPSKHAWNLWQTSEVPSCVMATLPNQGPMLHNWGNSHFFWLKIHHFILNFWWYWFPFLTFVKKLFTNVCNWRSQFLAFDKLQVFHCSKMTSMCCGMIKCNNIMELLLNT